MKVIKSNIWGFIIGILVCGVVSVSAYNLLAKDIRYKDTNVEAALNDLYTELGNPKITYESWGSGTFTNSSAGVAKTVTFQVASGVKKVKIYLSVTSCFGANTPSVTGSIITSSSITGLSSGIRASKWASNYYLLDLNTNGEAGSVTVNIVIGGPSDGNSADALVVYEK